MEAPSKLGEWKLKMLKNTQNANLFSQFFTSII